MEPNANPSGDNSTSDKQPWRSNPFHEPRAWALEWDVTELLKRKEPPAPSGSSDEKERKAKDQSPTTAG